MTTEKKKHPGIGSASHVYFASAKDNEKLSVSVEAERFYDARAVACVLLGVPDVGITSVMSAPRKPLPRWQVRWEGSAAGQNTLRKVVRCIRHENDDAPWIDLREARMDPAK